MHVLVTGASGIVGRFLVPALAAAGHRVTTLGRRPGDHRWDLAEAAPCAAAGRRARPSRPRPSPGRLSRRRGGRSRGLPAAEPRRDAGAVRRRGRGADRLPVVAGGLWRPPAGGGPEGERRGGAGLALWRGEAARRGGGRRAGRACGRPGSTAGGRTSGRDCSPTISPGGRSRRGWRRRSTATTSRRRWWRCSAGGRPGRSTCRT